MIAIGAQLSVGGATVEDLVEAATAYEEAGVESIWIGDHLIDYYDPRRTTPECFTTIAAILASTKRVRVGSLVASVLFRHPFVLAKTAGSLAELSGGRFELGLGAGGVRSEHVTLGFDFPPRSERVQRLERTLDLLRRLQEDGPTDGNERVDLQGVWCRPALGSTRIVVGAVHRRVAAVAGRYADEINVIDYAEGLDVRDVLEAATAAAGSSGRTLRRSVLVPASGEELRGGRHPKAGRTRAIELEADRVIYRLTPPFPAAERVLAEEV